MNTAEIKAAVDKLGETFEHFKAANDQQLAEIKANGAAYPETAEKVVSIEAAIEASKIEAQQLLARQDDLETRMNRIGMGGGKDQADLSKTAASFFSMVRKERIKPKDADVEAYMKYVDAWPDMIRASFNPDLMASDIRAAASVGTQTEGGYYVPAEMAMEIERRIFDTSPMRQVATVRSIGSSTWKAPYQSDPGITGGWVGERDPRPATDTAKRGMQSIETHTQYAYPEATQEILDDAVVDMEAIITQETSDVMARTENTGYVLGNGVTQPKGFLGYGADSTAQQDDARAWGVLQYVPSGASGDFVAAPNQADVFISTIAELNPGYRAGARWAMNRRVEATVRKLKDADGRYLVGVVGGIEDGIGFNLFGYPISNMEDMPDIAADSFSIALGNWTRGYYIVDRLGMSMLRDPYTNKPYVGFYMTKRTGGDVRNFDALKLIKFSVS